MTTKHGDMTTIAGKPYHWELRRVGMKITLDRAPGARPVVVPGHDTLVLVPGRYPTPTNADG